MKIEKQVIEKKLSFAELTIEINHVGEDFFILIHGGDKPHIGSVVLAIPRPSLKNDGSASCTSSVLNVTGHKDEKICRLIAEKFCKKFQTTVTCAGGFHVDNITEEKIQEVVETCEIF